MRFAKVPSLILYSNERVNHGDNFDELRKRSNAYGSAERKDMCSNRILIVFKALKYMNVEF
jgi:hypothetical protein